MNLVQPIGDHPVEIAVDGRYHIVTQRRQGFDAVDLVEDGEALVAEIADTLLHLGAGSARRVQQLGECGFHAHWPASW